MWPVSSGFKTALTAPIRDVTIRVTALDSNFNVIKDITDPTIEGTVYVDVDRATRRTCQIRLINKKGEYTPTDSDSIFWWDKQFKVEYGVKVGQDYEFVPLGVFMVDRPEVLAQKGVSVLNVDGSDQWKKLTFSTFASPQSWAIGTTYNTIITDIATAAGVSRFNLDPLPERATTEKTVRVPIFFEADDNRGEKLKEMAKEWNLDIYFDVNGYLTTRSFTTTMAEAQKASPNWTFNIGEDAIFLSITKGKSGDTIKNHVVVTGEADDGTPVVRGEAADEDDSSPTRITAIGDRVLHIRSKTLRTTAACIDLAKAELAKNKLVEEEITLPTIVVPMFEGRDVVYISEPNSATDDKYFLSAFDIPMRSSQQEIHVKKARNVSLSTKRSTFTANAILKKDVQVTFTGNAVLKKFDITSTFTANSVFLKASTATFTSNAILLKTTPVTFAADSVLQATVSGTFTADAELV